MRTYKIFWSDLTDEARKRLEDIYHANIELSPLAVIDIEEEETEN